MSALQCTPSLPTDPGCAPPGNLRHTAGKFYSTPRHQAVEPKRDRRLRNAVGQRATHSMVDQQFHQVFPVHLRKCPAQTLPGTCPCLEFLEVSEKRPAGPESRPPGAKYIVPAGSGMKVADSDADGLASPSIRQRPHTDAEEQLHGVLGDRGGETKGSSEVFAEVSGGDYLGHHRWVVFLFRRSTALRGRAEICPVDGNTRSAYRIPNGESRVLRPPPRKRPNSPTSPSACACRHAADGLAKPRAQGSGV